MPKLRLCVQDTKAPFLVMVCPCFFGAPSLAGVDWLQECDVALQQQCGILNTLILVDNSSKGLTMPLMSYTLTAYRAGRFGFVWAFDSAAEARRMGMRYLREGKGRRVEVSVHNRRLWSKGVAKMPHSVAQP